MSNKAILDPWQYRIALDGPTPVLELGTGLDQVALEDAAGTPIGTLIGFPIDLESQTRLTGGTHRVAARLGADPDLFAEGVLSELAGRFLWLCQLGDLARIYLDVSGQVPCVYDPQAQIAASSAHALLSAEAYDARFDRALHTRLGIGGQGWIPGGLTAHEGVYRLLPNHRLDLADFSVARHWPMTPLSAAKDPEQAVSTLIETVQRQVAALGKGQERIAQALTAGRETRMLLGCVRPHAKDIDFVTVAGTSQTDTVMAARIATGEGLSHRVVPLVMASAQARATYLRRNGDCIADANASSFPSVAPLADSHVFVGGAGGEVGRGFFWRPGDDAATPLDGAALMGRFGLPSEPRVIAALDTWCAGLAGHSTHEILDLAYIEQRMGPWGGAQFPSDPTLVRFAPLLSRAGVTAMMGLPEAWKRHEGMSAAVLRQTWPDLARYPFNTLGPVRDMAAKLGKVMRDPSAILRKLRKRFG